MKKVLCYVLAGLCCFSAGLFNKAYGLGPGDIVILGWNSDDTYPNQRWAFMTTVAVPAGTVLIFTDNGYDFTTSNFRTGAANDGYMTWVVPTNYQWGSVIYATNTTINGSTTGVTGSLGVSPNGFSTIGDQIIVYQGTSGTATGATFIYAANTGTSVSYTGGPGTWLVNGSGTVVTLDQLSYLPPGLTNGTTAVALTNNVGNTSSGTGNVGSPNYGFDNMYYGGSRSLTRSQLLAAVGNPSNWAGNGTTGNALQTGGVYPVDYFTLLPVSLLNFTADAISDNKVELKWATGREENNNHFIIERSTDGQSYTAIGIVKGQLNAELTTNYSFTDNDPEPGVSYYRLRQTDVNGTERILEVRTVTIRDVAVRISPNPATTAIDATFSAGSYRSIRLYTSQGMLLQTVSLKATDVRTRFSLINYTPGTYYMAFIGNDEKKKLVKKIVKR